MLEHMPAAEQRRELLCCSGMCPCNLYANHRLHKPSESVALQTSRRSAYRCEQIH
jgi:hypothetical protein